MARTIVAAALAAALATPIPLAAAPSTVKGVVDVQWRSRTPRTWIRSRRLRPQLCAARRDDGNAADGVLHHYGDYTRENNKRLLEFVAQQVEATGEEAEKDGKKLIDVSAIAASK